MSIFIAFSEEQACRIILSCSFCFALTLGIWCLAIRVRMPGRSPSTIGRRAERHAINMSDMKPCTLRLVQ